MSISLNNHESRIKALENGGASSWSKGSNANGNWVKESKTGLLIQWGSISSSGSLKYEVDQPFPVKYTQIPVVNKSIGGYYNGGFDMTWMQIKSISLDKFVHSVIGSLGSPVQWFAIGYLISYRILNYAYACKSLLFTPLRTMEV